MTARENGTGPSPRTTARLVARWQADPLWRAVRLLDVRWRRVAAAVALGTLALGCSVGLAAAAAWLVARASQMPPVLTLGVAVVAVRAFGIGRGVFRYLERLASHDVALRGMADLRANLYDALARGPVTGVVALRRGDLLARVGADVDTVGDVVVRALVPAGVAAVLSVGSVVLVGAFLPSAGLALAACLVLAGVLAPWLASRASAQVEERGAAARADMSAAALELLEDGAALRVDGRLADRAAALRDADRRLERVTADGARVSGWSAATGVAATGLAVLASLLLGIPAVAAGHLAAVELSVVVLTPLAVFEAANALPAAAVQLRRSRAAARRVVALLPAAGPQGAPTGLRPVPGPSPALVLDGVAAGWSEDVAAAAVRDVSLVLEPGRAVAVVGPSGVGKTTLLMTAAGLLPARGGTVTLRDPAAPTSGPGADVAASGAGAAERPGDRAPEVLVVAEDGHVFDTTVLENLRVARGDVTDDEAHDALAAVGLDGWLAGLPDGLATVLGSDATTVSGGERRRLLVARALLAPARYLLVDEPAEHLDAATADAVVARLVAEARGGRGVVLATHRLAALDAVDEVLLLGRAGPDEPARVVARGRHADLLRDDAAYRWALAQEEDERAGAGAPGDGVRAG